jgi:hypothetical protein
MIRVVHPDPDPDFFTHPGFRIQGVRHVTGNDQDYLRKILRAILNLGFKTIAPKILAHTKCINGY